LDPDTEYGSRDPIDFGSRDPIEFGYNTDPDSISNPQHWQVRYRLVFENVLEVILIV
jgi:hypothetical protein